MDKDKQIEILEKRVKWLERKVGQLEYENHVQDEEYMSLGGTLNNERMEHAKLQKEYAKLKKEYAKMEEENKNLCEKLMYLQGQLSQRMNKE